MSWQTPVTNWSSSSYFNYTDWNRIEGNCDAIVAFLLTCGYTVPITTISNRSDGSYLDFYDSLNRIENNIWAIFACYNVAPVGWVTPKTSWSYDQPFSYADTNRIEGNILALYNMVVGIIAERLNCGQSLAICGLTWSN